MHTGGARPHRSTLQLLSRSERHWRSPVDESLQVMDRELTAAQSGVRLDFYLAEQVEGLSRAHAQRLIGEGHVLVNGRVAKASLRLQAGDAVRVHQDDPRPLDLAPEPIPLAVVYEDRDLIVIDKPAGLTVHPAPGHPTGTLVNALLAHCTDLRGIEGTLRPGIVHRLDKDTSGLLVVAKHDRAQLSLSGQIARRETLKAYLALVAGSPPAAGVIDAPIGRHPAQRKRMAVVAEGRPARTHYRVVGPAPGGGLVAVVLETGRTHQIRVHFAALGYPVAGDPVYGQPNPGLGRQWLHAWRLGFRHPTSGAWLEFEAPLPDDLLAVLACDPAVLERMLQSARAAVTAMRQVAVSLGAKS